MNILITGAGGSLGQEFIKQLYKYHYLIAIDNNEWSIAEIRDKYPKVKFLLEDFVEWKFDQDPVDLIIHCAAYKHINLGEDNVNSFIDNNIIKTRKLFAEAYKNNADILFISTDKAVEPISLYGFTKAIGERLAKHYNGYVARLGNILLSSGSVIPIWENSIQNNKPIPITDLKMKRYVIEVSKAVEAIWQGYLSGQKLIIPICRKIQLKDLLQEVLKKHHKSLEDVDIEIIGRRPGEKLEEKLRWKDESIPSS